MKLRIATFSKSEMNAPRTNRKNGILFVVAAALAIVAPVNGQTRITSWTQNTPLPEASPTVAISHGSSILVFAASSGYIGTVDQSGTIQGWRGIVKPPAAGTNVGERYVVVGNSVVFASYPNSYVADFLPDGSLSTWRTAPGVNPRLNDIGNTVVTDGTYIWSIGGCCLGTLEPRLSTVDVATFENGVLSPWRALNDFPIAIQSAALSLIDGYLYVYGGLNNYGSLTNSRDVRRASIQVGGSLGPWEFVGYLLEPRPHGEQIVYKGTVHMIAGGVHTFFTRTVESVLAKNLGVFGQSSYSEPLPATRTDFGTAVVRNFGFVLGGCASAYCSTQSNLVFTAMLGPADTQPPVTTATPEPQPNGSGWNNTNVQVDFSAADEIGGSGVKQIQWKLSGAQEGAPTIVAGSTAVASITAEGHTSVTYFATDNAGNVESTRLLDVNIDKTPVAILGMPAPTCSLWPPNGKLVQVATVDAADTLSGLTPGSFRVTGVSNEPSDPKRPDIVITPDGTGRYKVELLADRLGTGSGRVYTLTATATDRGGNTTTTTATCVVPHDQGK